MFLCLFSIFFSFYSKVCECWRARMPECTSKEPTIRYEAVFYLIEEEKKPSKCWTKWKELKTDNKTNRKKNTELKVLSLKLPKLNTIWICARIRHWSQWIEKKINTTAKWTLSNVVFFSSPYTFFSLDDICSNRYIKR